MEYVEKPHVTTCNVSDAPKDVKTMTKTNNNIESIQNTSSKTRYKRIQPITKILKTKKQKRDSKNVYPSPKIVNIHEIVHIIRKHVTCKPHIVVRKIIITRTSLSRQNAPNRAKCWEFDATIKSHKCCTLVKLQSR